MSHPDIKNFSSLSKQVNELVKAQSWFSKYGIETVKFLGKFFVFSLGFFVFLYPNIVMRILGIIIMSYAYTGIAISGIHQASHKTMAKSKWANQAWAYFFTEFWTSKAHQWWNYRHIETHHPHPNNPEIEPQPFYFPWINAYVYFFLVPYLVVPWIMVSSMWYIRKQWKSLMVYVVLTSLGILFHAGLFYYAGFSILASLGLMLAMRSFFAPQFMHLAVFNHIGLTNSQERLPWITRQTLTTRNIKPNWFLTGLGGNAFLDGHLEHHLFPGVSNHILKKIRPLVVEGMEKDDYVYLEEGYFSCLRHCIKHYHALFKNLPHALW